MKIIKGFEGEDLEVSDFGEWVGKDYIDYKSEYETNQKIIKLLIQENQELKADYGTKAQVERDLLMEENKELKKQLEERPKEYVFIGNAQNKTRDFINQIIKENREYKEAIDKAINFIEKNKSQEYINGNLNEYYLELNEKEMTKLLEILKEVE